MQNEQTLQPDDDNLDLAQGPTSLRSLPEATAAPLTKSPSPSSETIQSDTEARPKVKGRSRFSSAIRKLSGSTRKKQHPTEKDKSPDPLPSSGIEEPVTSQQSTAAATAISSETAPKGAEPKKKSRLSKRFLLPALKKSKISPKTKVDEGDNDDGATTRDLDQVTKTDFKVESGTAQKPIKPAKESQTTTKAGAISSKIPTQSKVQITISGKKPSQKPEVLTETDYLTPTEGTTDIAAEPTTSSSSKATTTSEPLKATKKKFKAKKTTAAPTSTSSCTRTTSVVSDNPNADEKLVITQSTRDTPPNEQAPLKPSRTFSVDSSAFSQSTESTEATPAVIRKPTARAAVTLPSSFSVSQRFIGGAVQRSTAGKKQRISSIKAASVETDLMQTSPISTQRGHRLPRPSSTTTQPPSTTIETTTTASTQEDPEPIGELSPQLQQQLLQQRQKQRQIQFQLQSLSETQSHASQSLSQSIGTEVQQLQSSVSLQPPTYSPPFVLDSPAVTPETRSPTQQQQQQQHPQHQHTIPYADESVTTASSSGADDILSSAESATHQEDYDAEVALYLDSANKDTAISRRQDTASYDSNKSSGSQSPLSETSRKRIHYVAQPTIYDESESSRKQSVDFRLSTEAGESAFEADSDTADKQMPAFGDLTMDEEMEPTIMTSANVEKREHLYKILVIGELGTGKTSFIKRYVHQFFSQNYRATIGVDFALKVLHWDPNTIVRLQLWDIAGQERFGNMTRVYYKEAVGAFIVFDVTRSGTFECVSKWKEDLDSKVQLPDGSPIPCILLANKCDQEKQGIVTQPEKMDEYVKENGFAGWFETSAKENINIDEAARALVSKILLNDKLISASDLADSERFNLNNPADQTESESKKCSC